MLHIVSRALPLACLALALAALTPARAAEPVAKKAPTVAVLYFDYAGEDAELAPLRKGLAQMVITGLQLQTGARIVERVALQAVLDELKLAESRVIDKASAARVGKLLGADYLVTGGFFVYRATLRVDVRIIRVETGENVEGVGVNGPEDALFDLEQDLTSKLAVLVNGLTPREIPRPAYVPPPKKADAPARVRTKSAARYGKALDLLDRGQRDAARRELEAVVKDEPTFGLAAKDLAGLMQ